MNIEQIHESVVKKSRWNRSNKSIAWRVDVKAASKTTSEINEPIAIFEHITEAPSNSKTSTDAKVTRFEMNRTQVADMLRVLETIEKQIDDVSY